MHMALSKTFTKVTPFSKYLTMVLFIAFPFIGFYMGMQYQQMTTPSYPPPTYFSDPPIVKEPSTAMVSKAPMPEVKCAADMKQCPDKTYVHRSGPDCQFVCAK